MGVQNTHLLRVRLTEGEKPDIKPWLRARACSTASGRRGVRIRWKPSSRSPLRASCFPVLTTDGPLDLKRVSQRKRRIVGVEVARRRGTYEGAFAVLV